MEETQSLLNFLFEAGCKATKEKLQLAQDKVVFLGHCISHSTKHLTEDRKKAIQDVKEPKTKKQLRAFLGLVGYCREWIPNAASLLDPLYDATKGETNGPIQLTSDQQQSFAQIKKVILTSPALGLPQYDRPFTLFCHEQQGYVHGVLTQEHGGKQRPLGYYSCKLDPVIRGSPSCIRAVAAAALLKEKTDDLVLGHNLVLCVPHAVTEILNQARTKHLSTARLTKYEVALLSPSNLQIKRCTVLNPASLLPSEVDSEEGSTGDLGVGGSDTNDLDSGHHGPDGHEDPKPGTSTHPQNFPEHDCMATMELEQAHISPVKDIPLLNSDANYYVDSSRFYEDGHPKTGFAVTTETDIVIQQSLDPSCSAQEAELQAVIAACIQGENQRVNIYTDSRYAYGVAHDFGPIWKSRDFLGANGKPLKHAGLINSLFRALQMPKEVAIIKVKAHTKEQTPEARGNAKADAAAKAAAIMIVHLQTPGVQGPIDLTALKQFQRQAPEEEKEEWIKRGATEGNGIWATADRCCLPRVLYPVMAANMHGPTHVSKGPMVTGTLRHWIAPGFTVAAAAYTQGCDTCARHNPGNMVTVPRKTTPRPLYPFQRLQINYIQLPRCGKFEFVLVCTDLFTSWPEAFPVVKADAKTTAKKLLSEIVCRYGVPETIESDRGTHFTGEVMKNIMMSIGVSQAFHTPYHPQSSGKVERLNGTLKLKIQKAIEETGKTWVDCLPIALYSVRTTPLKTIGLSPYEILFGGPPKTGCYFPQQLDMHYGTLTSYMIQLTKNLTAIHAQVFSSIPDPDNLEGTHRLKPGDHVYAKKHIRKTLEPRFEGPYQVLLTTPTSVKLEGKQAWIHASHCKRVTVSLQNDKSGTVDMLGGESENAK